MDEIDSESEYKNCEFEGPNNELKETSIRFDYAVVIVKIVVGVILCGFGIWMASKGIGSDTADLEMSIGAIKIDAGELSFGSLFVVCGTIIIISAKNKIKIKN